MRYINNTIRRQDRLLDEERAKEILRTAEYGVMSMVDDNDQAYGIPVNFVWDGEDKVYIHCAPEGRKLRAIAKHPKVSLCVVGKTHLMPKNFTTEYESVIVFGTAHTGLSEEERMHALHLLIDKFAPEYKELGDKHAHASFHRTEIICIDLTEYSGKQKKMKHKEG